MITLTYEEILELIELRMREKGAQGGRIVIHVKGPQTSYRSGQIRDLYATLEHRT